MPKRIRPPANRRRRQTMFSLDPVDLQRLDALVPIYTHPSEARGTRSNVVEELIRAEYSRRVDTGEIGAEQNRRVEIAKINFARETVVAKKTSKAKQLNIRMPMDLIARLEATADLLATDVSHLLRLIVVEKLPEYEERARQSGRSDPTDTAEE